MSRRLRGSRIVTPRLLSVEIAGIDLGIDAFHGFAASELRSAALGWRQLPRMTAPRAVMLLLPAVSWSAPGLVCRSRCRGFPRPCAWLLVAVGQVSSMARVDAAPGSRRRGGRSSRLSDAGFVVFPRERPGSTGRQSAERAPTPQWLTSAPPVLPASHQQCSRHRDGTPESTIGPSGRPMSRRPDCAGPSSLASKPCECPAAAGVRSCHPFRDPF